MAALKRFAGYLALCTVVPLAMLLSLEGLASIAMLAERIAAIPAPERPPQAAHDSLLGWIGRHGVALPDRYGPGLSLTHDANGMRVSRPPATGAAAGAPRIVCSGGALVYGAGVADSQTMCAYLEEQLPGVRTVNMAQEAYGLDQAYLWYLRDGGRHPHRAHLVAFTRADLDRLTRTSHRGLAKPVLTVNGGELIAENVPIADGSASRWPEIRATLSDARLAHAIERRTGRTEAAQGRESERSLQLTRVLFRDLDRLNRERGSRAVLVYLPSLPDLRPGPNDERRAALSASARELAVPFVDLTASMRAVPDDTADWFFITPGARAVRGLAGQYSAAGHRWVAARLAEHLRSIPELARALEAVR